MSKLKNLQENIGEISSVRDLTETFEQIASIRIKEIRDQVNFSKQFINDIWNIYVNLRLGDLKQKEKLKKLINEKKNGRTIFVLITSTAGLSGEINKKITTLLLEDYKKGADIDIVAIGKYGQVVLGENKIPVKSFFDMPSFVDEKFIESVVNEIRDYANIFVYYEEFISINVQKPQKIELTLSDFHNINVKKEDYISKDTYIFEPSYEEVLEYFESIMFGVELSQKVMESKLAQFASRFIAMDSANDVADKMVKKLSMRLFSEKRQIKDRRAKELVSLIQKYEQNNR